MSSAKWRPFCLGLNVLNHPSRIYDLIPLNHIHNGQVSSPQIWTWYSRGTNVSISLKPLQWRHNGLDGGSNHRRLDCLLNRLFRRRSKKISKLRVTGLCDGNSPVTSEFPAQRASNAENVSNWWRHHAHGKFRNGGKRLSIPTPIVPAWWVSGFPGNLQQCTPWSVVMHICIIYYYVSQLEINSLLIPLMCVLTRPARYSQENKNLTQIDNDIRL